MKNKNLDSASSDESRLHEQTLSSRHVYDGTLLQVYVDEITLPNGTSSTRDWIKHPGASAIVPVFRDGTIMLLKQFRYPARKVFIEVPAGKIDPGESPSATAVRELKEECGLVSDHMEQVGSLFPAIGYADEEIFVFVAWGLKAESKNVDDDEFLLNHRVPFSRAISMIESGEIKDAKTISALMQTYFWWKKNAPFQISF